MPNLIVSTVGTSLLTNYVNRQKDQDLSLIFRDTANAVEKELASHQRDMIDEIIKKVDAELRNATHEELPRLSAELRGLLGYYGRDFYSRNTGMDHHVLVATDTYQGRESARLLEEHLKRLGINSVEILVPPGLSTRDCRSFTAGVNEVVRWCEQTLAGYRQHRYHIVFNLVGGFKSLQGYMNTLGMFYADEIIYIFEAPSADLIRIPRLPVVLDEIPVLQEKAVLFALMENGYFAQEEEVKGIPEIYLDFDGEGSYTLSTWGLLMWERHKQKILGRDHLLTFPALAYERSFEKDFMDITDKARRADIQTTLAKVSLLFREQGLAGLRKDSGLLYETYKGRPGNIGHFRLNQDWRVSCLPEGNILRLRHVGSHDYVNDNP
ncbi:putative CRISPR-associated protein (TIGR02619 family) [Desulfofundulus luciae]|uniref:CRISPR-associated protein (TIGR02619 family) n=1 Tax=Desulfofundulus luciae TaxID=74702 RepID=A0ABU0AZ57_9FIRM|nr:putative CRISPR-associated protein [Desulfofundulus luciae]MDQ0285543.1 putative CRISPR-associated protein (TIGR02619 family) [Desulfofundulus luciae]